MLTAPQDQTTADRRYLDVVAVEKAFRGVSVMNGMDFRVTRDELVSLLGPSGCAKPCRSS